MIGDNKNETILWVGLSLNRFLITVGIFDSYGNSYLKIWYWSSLHKKGRGMDALDEYGMSTYLFEINLPL